MFKPLVLLCSCLVAINSALGDAALEVKLPRAPRPLPEPLSPGKSEPGFKFRGTKGWAWTPEQYLEEIPVLARYKMNFLMNCYLSLFTDTQRGSFRNEWWKPLPEPTKQAYARIFQACRDNGITFCFAVHPQLHSPRPLNLESTEDIDQYYQHFAWAQSQGVGWFSVSLDDVHWGGKGPAAGGAAHVKLVNTVFARLRHQDPRAQLIFCPVPYWGDGTKPDHRAYLEVLARDLHPDVYVFWTGDGETAARITRRAAESYKTIVKHRLFLWDNYPVNDANPTLHLGPVSGRDPDLCELIDGYMSNPMATQSQINRIPLATCADYAYNPWAYNPQRSIGQAILHFGETTGSPKESEAQLQLLTELVETYPGFITTGGGTGANPVRKTFSQLAAQGDGHTAAKEYCQRLESLSSRLAKEFPQQFLAAQKTVADDVTWMKEKL
jgi:hypothetical protein